MGKLGRRDVDPDGLADVPLPVVAGVWQVGVSLQKFRLAGDQVKPAACVRAHDPASPSRDFGSTTRPRRP